MNNKQFNDSIIDAIYSDKPVEVLNLIKQHGIEFLNSRSLVEILIYADLDILKYCVESCKTLGYQIFRQHSLSYLTDSNNKNIESFKYMHSLGIFTLDSRVLEHAIFRHNIELVKYIHQELKIEIPDDIDINFITNFDCFKYVVDVFADQNKLDFDLIEKLFGRDDSFEFANYYLQKVYSLSEMKTKVENNIKIFEDHTVRKVLENINKLMNESTLNLMKYSGLRRFLMKDAKYTIKSPKFSRIKKEVDNFEKDSENIEQSIKESTNIISDVVKYSIMSFV
jgi:hypothetical protein